MSTPAPTPAPTDDLVTADDLLAAQGRREQKKRETRRALHRHAMELVLERGLAGVTTDDIARAAGVSPRTFFNYYPTKEASLTGVPEVIVEKVSRLAAGRPDDESPWQTARLVATRLLAVTTRDEQLWRTRRTLQANHPDVAALMLGSMRAIETGLVDALVARSEATGHPEAPWRPRMMALTALDAVRVVSQLGDEPQDLVRMLDEVLDAHDALHDAPKDR